MRNFNNTHVLVTGGNGAVGTNLVRKLLSLNANVTVLDDFSQSEVRNLPEDTNLTTIKGDITDEKILSKVFKRHFDYIFHLAARFANELSVESPLEDLRVNVQGTVQLLLRAAKNKPKRFLYTSSSSAYGSQKYNVIKESIVLKPSTPYAVSKLTGEYYCNAIKELYDLDYTVIRLSNSYGPYDPPGKYRNVIPNFFYAANTGKDIIITGTGLETRDFTYVDDCVNGIILAATNNNSKNEIFNLGTGKETTIKKIASLILKVSESKSKIVYKPRRNFDHIKRRKMDITKARTVFQYKPSVSIEDGLQRTYEWFLSNYTKS